MKNISRLDQHIDIDGRGHLSKRQPEDVEVKDHDIEKVTKVAEQLLNQKTIKENKSS